MSTLFLCRGAVSVRDYFYDEHAFVEYTAQDAQTIIEQARHLGGRYDPMLFKWRLDFRFPDEQSLTSFLEWVRLFNREKVETAKQGRAHD